MGGRNRGIIYWQICQPAPINMCTSYCVFSRALTFVELTSLPRHSGNCFYILPKISVADPDPNPDPPDPHVFGPPGSGSTSQRYGSGSCSGSGSGSFYHHAKIVRKTLIPTILWLFLTFIFRGSGSGSTPKCLDPQHCLQYSSEYVSFEYVPNVWIYYLYGELDFDSLAVWLGPEEVCIDELHLVQVLQLLQAQRHQLSRDKRKNWKKNKSKRHQENMIAFTRGYGTGTEPNPLGLSMKISICSFCSVCCGSGSRSKETAQNYQIKLITSLPKRLLNLRRCVL